MEEINIEEIKPILDKIKMMQVWSSNILAIGYDENSRILKVFFQNRSCYAYFNVEPEVWNNLLMSESKGRTLNESIVRHKDKYKFMKLM